MAYENNSLINNKLMEKSKILKELRNIAEEVTEYPIGEEVSHPPLKG